VSLESKLYTLLSGDASVSALVVALLLCVGSAVAITYQFNTQNALIKGNLDVVGAIGGGFDPLKLKNSETIDNALDDMVDLQGVGGADNTDIRFDLDGTHPVLSSPTDTRIEMAEDVTVLGDLTITGDDIFATTNTSGALTVTGSPPPVSGWAGSTRVCRSSVRPGPPARPPCTAGTTRWTVPSCGRCRCRRAASRCGSPVAGRR